MTEQTKSKVSKREMELAKEAVIAAYNYVEEHYPTVILEWDYLDSVEGIRGAIRGVFHDGNWHIKREPYEIESEMLRIVDDATATMQRLRQESGETDDKLINDCGETYVLAPDKAIAEEMRTAHLWPSILRRTLESVVKHFQA